LKKNILILVGTRPNFIKVTQFKRFAHHYPNLNIKIVHTGQHYDAKMADVFFEELDLKPDYFLNTPSGNPATQIGEIIIRLEKLITETFCPDLLIVPGDVNSTLAGALTANKMNIPLAHLESGLRSNDRSMPEEINRIITDSISDHCFVTEESGITNLKNEQFSGQIHFVGNTMIDTLVAFEPKIDQSTVLKELNINHNPYVLMTIHRPSNVDSLEGLNKLMTLIDKLSINHKIVFPVHPRTTAKLEMYGLKPAFDNIQNLILTGPLGYLDFQKLVKHAKLILTDSGGIQEESTYRKVPCLTLRENTERPVTITHGTNTLVPFEVETILGYLNQIENGTYKKGEIPALWDGNATERILKIISA